MSRTSNNGLKFKFSQVNEIHSTNQIINLELLQSHVTNITLHACMCSQALAESSESPIKVVTEVQSYGIASVISSQCKGCKKVFKMETSRKLTTDANHVGHYDINVRAVWGSMVTGNGAAHPNESLGTMNLHGLKKIHFF